MSTTDSTSKSNEGVCAAHLAFRRGVCRSCGVCRKCPPNHNCKLQQIQVSEKVGRPKTTAAALSQHATRRKRHSKRQKITFEVCDGCNTDNDLTNCKSSKKDTLKSVFALLQISDGTSYIQQIPQDGVQGISTDDRKMRDCKAILDNIVTNVSILLTSSTEDALLLKQEYKCVKAETVECKLATALSHIALNAPREASIVAQSALAVTIPRQTLYEFMQAQALIIPPKNLLWTLQHKMKCA